MGKINFKSPTSNFRRWTYATFECYKRNCICTDCPITPEAYHDVCCIKDAVLNLYRVIGKPEEKNYDTFDEQIMPPVYDCKN